MRLTLSLEKTYVTHVDAGFDMLGFRIMRAPQRGKKRVAYTLPRKRALRDVMHRIKALTSRSTMNLSLDQLIHALHPILRGLVNYAVCFREPSWTSYTFLTPNGLRRSRR